jgi:hypothetical protein
MPIDTLTVFGPEPPEPLEALSNQKPTASFGTRLLPIPAFDVLASY